MEKKEPKFIFHQAVVYNDIIARVEEINLWHDGRTIYLIQTCDHKYKYIFEEDLQDYIG